MSSTRCGNVASDRPAVLTPHFEPWEFDSHDGEPVPLLAWSGVRLLCQWWLEPFREVFGVTFVISGYRSAEQNRKVNGAPRSYHRYDLHRRLEHSSTRHRPVGADVRGHRGGPLAWAEWAEAHRAELAHLEAHGRGGIGVYPGGGHVHLDTGPLRSWTG